MYNTRKIKSKDKRVIYNYIDAKKILEKSNLGKAEEIKEKFVKFCNSSKISSSKSYR